MNTSILSKKDKEWSEAMMFLIPELKDYIFLFGVKLQTLKIIVSLPGRDFSYFKGNIKTLLEYRYEYLPDFLASQEQKFANTQNKLYSVLNFLINLDEKKKAGKRFLIGFFPEQNQTLWADFRTQKLALYKRNFDVHLKENDYIVEGYFFPSKI